MSIKQVRLPTGNSSDAKNVSPGPTPLQKPHIEVTVRSLGSNPTEGGTPGTKGNAMIDTGAAITLLTKKWADTHELKITPKDNKKVTGASGSPVVMLGVTSFTMRLSPTLEIDVADVGVC